MSELIVSSLLTPCLSSLSDQFSSPDPASPALSATGSSDGTKPARTSRITSPPALTGETSLVSTSCLRSGTRADVGAATPSQAW